MHRWTIYFSIARGSKIIPHGARHSPKNRRVLSLGDVRSTVRSRSSFHRNCEQLSVYLTRQVSVVKYSVIGRAISIWSILLKFNFDATDITHNYCQPSPMKFNIQQRYLSHFEPKIIDQHKDHWYISWLFFSARLNEFFIPHTICLNLCITYIFYLYVFFFSLAIDIWQLV